VNYAALQSDPRRLLNPPEQTGKTHTHTRDKDQLHHTTSLSHQREPG
jgi:hypothetical protein